MACQMYSSKVATGLIIYAGEQWRKLKKKKLKESDQL